MNPPEADPSSTPELSLRYKDALREVNDLRRELQTLRNLEQNADHAMHSMHGLELLLLRIGTSHHIQYVNSAFCEYFSVPKEELLGQHQKILESLAHQALLEPLRYPPTSGTRSFEAMDDKGDTYLVKFSRTTDSIDVVMENITDKQKFREYVQKYIGSDLTTLSDDDLTTFRFPERRFMSVSFTNLRGFTKLSETLIPEAVRKTINTYLQAVILAIESNQGTIDKMMGDEVMALFGAPRYYRDHALRVLKTAFEQLENIDRARLEIQKLGLTLPGCGIGISTGEMVVGSIGSQNRKDYTVMGSSVSIGAKLGQIARDKEVLITEATLNNLLQNLPPNWIISEKQSNWENPGVDDWQEKPSLKLPIQTHTEGGISKGIYPLTENAGRTFSIGTRGHPTYQFKYVYALRVRGVTTMVPVLLASSLTQNRNEKILSETPSIYDGVRMLGKYQLVEILGKGGMGEVWKARDGFGNTVAVKTLITHGASGSRAVQQFLREAEIMSKLQHKNICRIFEVGEIDSIPYIVMEYIEGTPLSRILSPRIRNRDNRNITDAITIKVSDIDENTPIDPAPSDNNKNGNSTLPISNALPWKRSIEIIQKMCGAVGFAHAHGIIHRDIKPQNIMIRPDGEPLLMDFGVAKMNDGPVGNSGEKKQVFGTLEYMAPEQALARREDDERVDIYGLGAVFYQMVTGRKHFQASRNLLSDLKRLQSYQAKSPKLFCKTLPADVEYIILKSLAPRPSQRYQNVAEFESDLTNFSLNRPVKAHPQSMAYTLQKHFTRFKLAYTVTSSFGLLVLAFLAILFFQTGKQHGNWIKIAQEEFNRGRPDLSQWQFLPEYPKYQNFVLNQDGLFLIPGVYHYLNSSEYSRLYRDLRIDISLTLTDKTAPIEIWFNASSEISPRGSPLYGYRLSIGKSMGTVIQFEKIDRQGKSILDWQKYLDDAFYNESKYHIYIEKNNGMISISLNKKLLAKIDDPAPYQSRYQHRIAIVSMAGHSYLKNFTVYRESHPEVTSPLLAGEALWEAGKTSSALEELLVLSEDYEGTSVAEEALAKAYQVAMSDPKLLGHNLEPIYKDFEANYPNSPWLSRLKELRALHLWKSEAYTEALAMLTEILKQNPSSSLPLWLPKGDLPEDIEEELLKILSPYTNIYHYHLRNQIVNTNSISSFPKLEILEFPTGSIEQLPLAFQPTLKWLTLASNRISDASFIYHLPMGYVDLSYNHLSKVAIDTSHSYRAINLRGNQIASMSGLSKTSFLDLGENTLRSLEQYDSLPTTLYIDHNLIEGGLPKHSPYHLNASFNTISSLDSVQNKHHGRWNLSHTYIEIFTHLKGHDFEELDLSHTRFQSLPESLSVTSLKINGNSIPAQMIWPLNLTLLECSECFWDTMELPKGLRSADFSYTNLQDLSLFNSFPLHYLNVEGNPIKNFGSFAFNPPDTFKYYQPSLDPVMIQNAFNHWTKNKISSFNRSYTKIVIAVLDNDVSTLKQMGTLIDQKIYLKIPFSVTPTQAREIASQLKANLAILSNPNTYSQIQNEVLEYGEYWIGLSRKNNELVWDDGGSIRNMPLKRPLRNQIGTYYALSASDGKWIDLSETDKREFVIEWKP